MKNYINRIAAAVLFFVLQCCLAEAADNVSVVLNGEKIEFGSMPVIENNRTLVPFRTIFEKLDYSVEWKESDRTVVAKKEETVIKLTIDSHRITLNEEAIISDTAPVIIDSTTYVPVRIISECSGCDVLWDNETKTVLVYTKQEEFDVGINKRYSESVTDGEYIYSSDENGVYRFNTDLEKEDLPIGFANDISVYNGKIYGRFTENSLHYCSFDLATHEICDISKEDIAGGIIYDGWIYYSYLRASVDELPKNTGIFRMDINGEKKEQITEKELVHDLYISQNLIFSGNHVISMADGSDKLVAYGYVTATALDNENYYVAVAEYTDERTPLKPLGINVYNIKNDITEMIPYDSIVSDIEVTDNSIFITAGDGYRSCSLIRMTKDFKYPVEIKAGVLSEFDIIGNYAYVYDTADYSRHRVSSDGSEDINLDVHWGNLAEPDEMVTLKITYRYTGESDISGYFTVLERRLDALGYTDAVIENISDELFNVNLKVKKKEDGDYSKLAGELVRAGVLTLQDSDDAVVLDNSNIVFAKAEKGTLDGISEESYVLLELTDEGRMIFASATEIISQRTEGRNYIAILLDGERISAPLVAERIDSNFIVISGNITDESAHRLAEILNAGLLPCTAETVDIKFDS